MRTGDAGYAAGVDQSRSSAEAENRQAARTNAQRENAVIRQAISCDICGTEKRQTNHWFVAWEQAGELRVSNWSSRKRLGSGTKHLCGQSCLHKLVDDFMARSMRIPTVADAATPQSTDTSLAGTAAWDERGSPARLLTAVAPGAEEETAPFEASGRYASRSWHAEAWERERGREMRSVVGMPESKRRQSIA